MMSRIVNLFVLAAFFSTVPAVGDDKKEELSKAEKRVAQFEAKHEPRGKSRRCVPLRSLRNSKVLDDQTIMFEGPGKRVYLNRLPRKCPRLAYEQRFSFSTPSSSLCSSDIITVIDNMGTPWHSCGLGEFEEWERRPKDETGSD